MGFEKTNTRGMRSSSRLLSLLYSAISEWCLIILLFLIASLSHLATKLALTCKLPIPCLLCTRLDHILSNGRRGCYKNFLCHKHKLEISSLSLCHNHQKLVDAREMCDKCLISSIIQKKQKAKSCKGGLEYSSSNYINNNEDTPSNVPCKTNKSSEGCAPVCFCCDRPLRNNNLDDAVDAIKDGDDDDKTNKKKQQQQQQAAAAAAAPKLKPYKSESPEFDGVGYHELNIIASDSESEQVMFADGDHEVKERWSVMPPGDPTTTTVLPIAKEKEKSNVPEESSAGVVQNELRIPPPPKIDMDDGTNRTQNGKGSNAFALSKSVKNASTELPSERCIPETSNNVYVVSTASSPKISKAFGPSNSISYQVGGDVGSTIRAHMERNDSLKHALNNNNNNKGGGGGGGGGGAAAGGGLASPKLSELLSSKDFSRGGQDDPLKARLSRKSSGKNFELPWNDLVSSSPKLIQQLQGDEITRSWDASSNNSNSNSNSRGGLLLHNISQRIGIERNYSSLESVEINIVSEIEGESPVERLKRQVELDKKSMTALYKELEEERSASAIAANEAMAMINRLQEEKASMQMEALHYLRMMEEQAEYDQEAIQKLNDLLTEREQELLDLEAELDSYRKQLGEELAEEKVIEPLGVSKAHEINLLTPRYMMKTLSYGKSDNKNSNNMYGSDVLDDPFYGSFEEEKAQISECLNRLKERLHAISVSDKGGDGAYLNLNSSAKLQNIIYDGTNGFVAAAAAAADPESEHSKEEDDDHIDDKVEKASSMPNQIYDVTKDDDFSAADFSVQLLKVEKDDEETKLKIDGEEDRGYFLKIKSKRISLQDEISSLCARMDALETDKKLLDTATNMLRSGTYGVQYVHEIACHLQDLRRIWVSHKEEIVG